MPARMRLASAMPPICWIYARFRPRHIRSRNPKPFVSLPNPLETHAGGDTDRQQLPRFADTSSLGSRIAKVDQQAYSQAGRPKIGFLRDTG